MHQELSIGMGWKDRGVGCGGVQVGGGMVVLECSSCGNVFMVV